MHWATVAGDQALANLAPDEAAAWFRTALAHAHGAGSAPNPNGPICSCVSARPNIGPGARPRSTPSRPAPSSPSVAMPVRRWCAPALATDRGWMTVSSFAPKQLAIVEAALARIDADDPATRARVLALLAQSLVHTDQADRRTSAALEALELARASADPLLLARVAPDILYALWAPGSTELRGAVAAEAVAIADEAGDPHLAFVVSGAAYNVAVCRGDAAAGDLPPRSDAGHRRRDRRAAHALPGRHRGRLRGHDGRPVRRGGGAHRRQLRARRPDR